MNFISNIFGGGSKKVIDGDDNKKGNLFSAENKEKINKLLNTLKGIEAGKIEKVLKEKKLDGKKLDEKEVKSKTNKIQTFISGLIKYIENNKNIPVKSYDNKIPSSLPLVGQQQVASVVPDGRKSRRSRRSKRSKRTTRRSKRSKRTTRRSKRSKRATRRSRRSKRSRHIRSIKHMKIRSSRKTKRM